LRPLSGEVLDGALLAGLLAVALLSARPAGRFALACRENARLPAAPSARTRRPALSAARAITLLRAHARPIDAEDPCCPAPVAVAPGDGSSLLPPVLVPDRRP
jgi:hypothetical protein